MDNTTNNVTTVPSKKKEKMKQIRKEQYQKFELSGINLNTSEIKIDDFLEARKKELSNFIDILSHKVSTKGGHQLLPKHMRRRAMSHNPFRIGVKNIIGKFNSETTSKCRKHKLKKKHFLKSINRRRIKTNWLETHIWHAKRFRMTTLFNRKLAFSRADKSLKACLKYSKYSSIIYDKSYFESILIDFVNNENMSLFFNNNNTLQLNSKDEFSIKYHNIILKDKNNEIIGPIDIIHLGLFNMLISFHPLLKEEIISFIKDFKDLSNTTNIKLTINKKINLFEIHGNTNSLYKLINLLSVDKNLLQFKSEVNFYSELIKKDVTIIPIIKPQPNFKINENVINGLTKYIETEYSNCLVNSYESNLNMNDIFNHFLNKSKSELELSFKKLTERTNLCRRNKINPKEILSKIDNMKNKHKQAKDNKDNRDKLNDQYKLNELKSNETTYLIIIPNKKYKLDSCNINNQQLRQDYYFKIFFISGFSQNLLRIFSYLDTKVLGYIEYKQLFTECTNLFYPEEFPSTKSNKSYIIDQAFLQIEQYCKYPSSKRYNYQKLKIKSPFYPKWNFILNNTSNIVIIENIYDNKKCVEQLENCKNKETTLFLIPIIIKMKYGGIVTENSTIHLPTSEVYKDYLNYKKLKKDKHSNFLNMLNKHSIEDYHLFNQQEELKIRLSNSLMEKSYKTNLKTKEFNKEFSLIQKSFYDEKQKLKEDMIEHNSTTILDKELCIKTPDSKYSLIGYITSGCYSADESSGVGKGFISVKGLKDLNSIRNNEIKDRSEEMIVLTRNTNSLVYKIASYRIISSNII